MNSLATQAIAGAAVLVTIVASAVGAWPLAIDLVSAIVVAAAAYVAFVAQAQRLSDQERLVYRPVYVRRHDVHRRVRSDD